jgi:cholesterol transport system auxiliary component
MMTLVIFVSLPITACSTMMAQPSQKIDFYTLEYAPPQVQGLKPLPVTIRVERFTVAPLYNTTQIIFRDRSFKRDAYVYRKWRANPGDLVTYFLARDLRESRLFKAVSPHGSRVGAQVVLEGSVDEFLELETEDVWKAVLAVTTTLVVDQEPDISKRILFQKSFTAVKDCRQKNPMGLAEAMSEGMAEISSQITRAVYDALKKE